MLRGALKDVWPKTYSAPTRTCSGMTGVLVQPGRGPYVPLEAQAPEVHDEKSEPYPLRSGEAVSPRGGPARPVDGRGRLRGHHGARARQDGSRPTRGSAGEGLSDLPAGPAHRGGFGIVTTPAGPHRSPRDHAAGPKDHRALPSPTLHRPLAALWRRAHRRPYRSPLFTASAVTRHRWRSLQGLCLGRARPCPACRLASAVPQRRSVAAPPGAASRYPAPYLPAPPTAPTMGLRWRS